MKNFIERPASRRSILQRSLVLGVGINDSDYITSQTVNGKLIRCPFYNRWTCMIERCHSKSVQKRYPTYLGCSICDEWLTFSTFKSWMEKQDWKGNHIDKDIIKPGNKIYCPEFCAFVDGDINRLISSVPSITGRFPTGVNESEPTERHKSSVTFCGDSINLGLFKSEKQAFKVYLKIKALILTEASLLQKDPRVANGLRLHAEILTRRESHEIN